MQICNVHTLLQLCHFKSLDQTAGQWTLTETCTLSCIPVDAWTAGCTSRHWSHESLAHCSNWRRYRASGVDSTAS